MSTSPHSFKLIRSSIALMESSSGRVLRVIALRYNSYSLTRSLQAQRYEVHQGRKRSDRWESGEFIQLTDINAHARNWSMPKVSIFSWKSEDGKTIEGVLELPAGFRQGRLQYQYPSQCLA